MSLFDLTGRTALVTGATQGLGLAIVQALASHGARLIVSDRDAAGCD
jgi:NAD(P)-dependent dehydrogenase (short-subunit alcohol dehydrogenase family)